MRCRGHARYHSDLFLTRWRNDPTTAAVRVCLVHIRKDHKIKVQDETELNWAATMKQRNIKLLRHSFTIDFHWLFYPLRHKIGPCGSAGGCPLLPWLAHHCHREGVSWSNHSVHQLLKSGLSAQKQWLRCRCSGPASTRGATDKVAVAGWSAQV